MLILSDKTFFILKLQAYQIMICYSSNNEIRSAVISNCHRINDLSQFQLVSNRQVETSLG